MAGFVLSLIGLLSCGLLSPVGLILSLAGLSKEPSGLAVAGTIIGGLGSLWIFSIALLFLLGVIGAAAGA